MVVGERADFGPGHADGADGFQIAQQRNVKRAAPTTQPCQFPRGGLCWEIDLGVGNLEYLSPADRFAPTDGRKRSWEKSLEGSVGRRVGPRVCRQVYRLIDDAEHRRRETVDDPVGAGRNRLEHRLHVRRRAGDDLEDVGGGGLTIRGGGKKVFQPPCLGLRLVSLSLARLRLMRLGPRGLDGSRWGLAG